jgi:isopenicillin-N N-acyltransferase-like protein
MIETTARLSSVLEGPGPHTNHYLDPELASIGSAPSTGSLARYDRLLELAEEFRPDSPEGVMEILRDHGDEGGSICLHPDPADGEEAAAVVFSMVADLESGRMWVAPGNPCTVAYEEIDLSGLF